MSDFIGVGSLCRRGESGNGSSGYLGREFDTGRPGNRDWLQEALTFRSWGWSILPIGFDKRPTVGWKQFQTRKMSDREIGHRFSGRTNVTGLAVVLGRVSGGLACRDFDTVDSYCRWSREFPDLASRLPTVRTARGYHVYFRCYYERFHKFPDGEYRGRGYIILPPSIHPSGVEYKWVSYPSGYAEFEFVNPYDAGLLPRIITQSGQQADAGRQYQDNTLSVSDKRVRFEHQAESEKVNLDEVIARNIPLGPGQRNDCLFRLATAIKWQFPQSCAEDFRGTVKKWWRLARPNITTKSLKVSWSDFCRQWCYVRIEETRTPAENLSPEELLFHECETLARLRPNGVFHLSVRDAAERLKVSDSKAQRLLKQARKDGWLEVVHQGKPHPRLRKATEYRLNRSHFARN